LGDGLDVFFVEQGIVGWSEFAVGRFGGVFGGFGGGEPGLDEAGPNKGSGRYSSGADTKPEGSWRFWYRVILVTA
jgi:hypothetical protein